MSSALLVKALQEYNHHVKAVISSSAIGWYGKDKKADAVNNGFLETDPPDEGFLGTTCKLWEESIEPVIKMNIRLIKFRTGIVLSNEGGAFPEFKRSLKFGIASILGSGKQVVSWIHIDDLCRMFIYALETESLHGAYNAVSPNPISNKKLVMKTARIMRGSFFVPVHVPGFILKILMGQRSIEILKSTTVNSNKIREAGFEFLYPTIDQALKDLCTP